MSINHIETEDLRRMEGKGGLILQGCGGELQEWLDGINEMFTEAGILKNGAKFQDISAFEYDGLTCLLYPFEGVDLEIRPAALKAIARKALARKTGARGLRSILEQSLISTMFDLPNTSNVEKVVVDESTIEENKPPLLVYREAAKKA